MKNTFRTIISYPTDPSSSPSVDLEKSVMILSFRSTILKVYLSMHVSITTVSVIKHTLPCRMLEG